jgi:hypothetical protein
MIHNQKKHICPAKLKLVSKGVWSGEARKEYPEGRRDGQCGFFLC